MKAMFHIWLSVQSFEKKKKILSLLCGTSVYSPALPNSDFVLLTLYTHSHPFFSQHLTSTFQFKWTQPWQCSKEEKRTHVIREILYVKEKLEENCVFLNIAGSSFSIKMLRCRSCKWFFTNCSVKMKGEIEMPSAPRKSREKIYWGACPFLAKVVAGRRDPILLCW